jgi:hypothetical protein
MFSPVQVLVGFTSDSSYSRSVKVLRNLDNVILCARFILLVWNFID